MVSGRSPGASALNLFDLIYLRRLFHMSSADPTTERAYERYAWIIFFAFGILMLMYSFYLILFPYFQPDHWDWLTLDGEVVRYISNNFKWMGSLAMGFSIFILATSLTSYRRGDRSAWYAFWYFPIFWLLAMIFTWMGPWLIPFFVLSLAGLLLSYRRFFPKEC